MPGYRVVFIGHVNEMTRPGGFPQQVVSNHVVEAPDKAAVYELVQQTLKKIMNLGGMGVIKPEFADRTIDPEASVENSMLVPIHMFSHLTVDIQVLAGSLEDGGLLN